MNRTSFLLLFVWVLPVVVWSQTPVAGEFQVNSYTTDSQSRSSVAMNGDGDFVVVWDSRGQDGSLLSVFAQRFDRDSTPLGGEFRINSFTTYFQEFPAVGIDTDGDFVVVWDSNIQDGSGKGIFGQRLAADGTDLGVEFQVNLATASNQGAPSIAMDPGGDFVVVWQSYMGDGNGYGIFGRRFAPDGTPLGGEFQVNSFTTGVQLGSSVAKEPDGGFVVVWQSLGQDGNSTGVFGQRFAADGTSLGGEFQVNTYTTSFQGAPSVAMDSDGDFVVVWESDTQDGSDSGVFGRRFAAGGAPLGGEFRVNTYTTERQTRPSVAIDPDGDFVVVWNDFSGQDGSGFGIFGQQFSSDGTPHGAEFQVNTYTTYNQGSPSLAMGPNGDFVIIWQSYGQDGSSNGIFGQVFDGPGFTSGTPTITLTVSGGSPFAPNVFTTGSSMNVGANVNNPGAASDEAYIAELLTAADFYFGALLPDGDTIVFVTDFATLSTGVGTLSDLSTLSPITVGAGFDLAGAFIFNDPSLLSFTFTGAETPGAYTLFLAAVLPGRFADGVADPGDIIALGTAGFTFTP